MTHTAVLFGGPSPEHDVSILTGLQAARELSNAGHRVNALYWSKAGDWYNVSPTLEGSDFLQGLPKDAEPVSLLASNGGGFRSEKKGMLGSKSTAIEFDVAVMCLHGGPGEDGSLQAALDLAGVRYTGPTASGAALGMDKLAFGGVVTAAGLPSLPRVLITPTTDAIGFDGPYILKPRFGGSSIGIEVVDSLDTAKALLKSSPHFKAGAVAEPYLPDSYDLNVAVRLSPRPQLSAIEKPTRAGSGGQILGYNDKYVGGEGMVSAPRQLPALIDDDLEARLRVMALHVAELVGVRGVQRIDFLANGNDLYVNEINTIPGSLSKHLFVEPTVAFSDLLNDMLLEAVQRPTTFWTSSGADGAALRSAGTIAGKLA